MDDAPDELTLFESLRHLSTAFASKVHAVQRAEEHERMCECWDLVLNEESYASPVTFLPKPDDTVKVKLGEMDGLYQDAGRVVNRKYAMPWSRTGQPSCCAMGTMCGTSPWSPRS